MATGIAVSGVGTSAVDVDVDDVDGDVVSSFFSVVGTPRPRHNGHAFRPDINHYN